MLKKTISTIFLMTFFCCSTISLAAKQETKTAPIFVETTVVKAVSHIDQTTSTGTLISIPGITIKPEISGRVTKIYFKSGDIVLKNSPLIEINPDIIKAELEQDIANLKLNKLNFTRATSLYKTHDISKADFDKAQAEYNSAKARVEGAKAKLQQTTILAPFSGKLGLSQINLGDFVSAGQTNIVNLQTLDPLKVDFDIPEIYQSKVAIGQTVVLYTDAYPKETFGGKVEATESLINQNNRTLNIRANVPNKEGKLIPGGFVEVALHFAAHQVIMVPQTAIVYSSDGNYIYKVVDGKAEKTVVVLGEKDKDNVIVKSGLKIGDTIVTAGQIKLHPGAQVLTAKAERPVTNKKS